MSELIEVASHCTLIFAIILASAKIFGEIFERYLHLPPVLGELVAGMLIGPFALGGLIFDIFFFKFGPLIPSPIVGENVDSPISFFLYTLAQMGAVLLLFITGMETDPKDFMAVGKVGLVVAFGGVILPFIFGYSASIFQYGDQAAALFVATIMTATSVGITARVLTDIKKIRMRESTTILAAAVIDDIIGIIILVIVVGTTAATGSKVGYVSNVASALGIEKNVVFFSLLIITFAAIFWFVVLYSGIKLSKKIDDFLNKFKTEGAPLTLALSFSFLIAFIAESIGLAMIIGAYVAGMSLAKTNTANRLRERIYGIYHFLVPAFFVVMGMLVNVGSFLKSEVLIFGCILTILAIIGKVAGCAIPAKISGFSKMQSLRVGFGMLPRGEVALIVAGYALALSAVPQDVYDVTIMMTAITTVMTPPILMRLFRKGD